MASKYRIYHSFDYAETFADNQYVIVKIYNENAEEIGQIKLELIEDGATEIKISPSGDIHIVDNTVPRLAIR